MLRSPASTPIPTNRTNDSPPPQKSHLRLRLLLASPHLRPMPHSRGPSRVLASQDRPQRRPPLPSATRLRRLGYRVLIIWECQTTDARCERLRARIKRFLRA